MFFLLERSCVIEAFHTQNLCLALDKQYQPLGHCLSRVRIVIFVSLFSNVSLAIPYE